MEVEDPQIEELKRQINGFRDEIANLLNDFKTAREQQEHERARELHARDHALQERIETFGEENYGLLGSDALLGLYGELIAEQSDLNREALRLPILGGRKRKSRKSRRKTLKKRKTRKH